MKCDFNTGQNSDYENDSIKPQRSNPKDLSDLVRDLNLSKEGAELLGWRLNEKNLLDRRKKIHCIVPGKNGYFPFLLQRTVLCSVKTSKASRGKGS